VGRSPPPILERCIVTVLDGQDFDKTMRDVVKPTSCCRAQRGR
jgi:hypothetical protein